MTKQSGVSEFAALLKEAHSKSGLTNKEFAAKLKTSTAVIWRWEKGLHVPTIEMADKVFKALGMTMTIGKEGE